MRLRDLRSRWSLSRDAQNLGRELHDVALDPMWRHGRGWLSLRDDVEDRDAVTFSACWRLGRGCERAHASLTVMTESDDVVVGIGLPRVFSLFLGVKALTWAQTKALGLADVAAVSHGFDVASVSVSPDGVDTFVSAAVWSQTCFDSADEIRRWSWFPVSSLTGGRRYLSDDELLDERVVRVSLPEDDYDVRVRVKRQRRVWNRLPLPDDFSVYAQVDVVSGSGLIDGHKGLRGLSCQAQTIHDAVGAFMAAVCRDRGGDFAWSCQAPNGLRQLRRIATNSSQETES